MNNKTLEIAIPIAVAGLLLSARAPAAPALLPRRTAWRLTHSRSVAKRSGACGVRSVRLRTR